MDTAIQIVNPEQSGKTSLSEADQEIVLMRIELQRLNRIRGDESPEEIRAAYERSRAQRQAQTEAADNHRHQQMLQGAHEAELNGLRRLVRRYGGNPDGMSDAELHRAAEHIRAEIVRLQEAAKQRQQEEERKTEYRRLVRKSECPLRHLRDLDAVEDTRHPQWTELRDVLVDQAKYASGYLCALLGPRGTGKTQLAVSVIDRCCRRLMTCRYVKALDLFRDFRRAYTPVAKGKAGESEDDIIREWIAFDLLVIDECHQRGETAWEQNTLINLLDRRYDATCCTILIANQSVEVFAEAVTDSIVSRIHQTGTHWVCDWPSFRKKGDWMRREGDPLRQPSGVRGRK